MSKFQFNKLHFGMGVLMYIKFAEQLWTAASDTSYLAHFLVAFKKESICISWKLNERQKNLIVMFLKGG